ncbi:MAG: CheY-like chemotaxis protein [Verrucomicrobiales bacterium]|jgi:CheY-like chemotaxis protein
MAKILVVEDDPNNVEILHDLLTDEGYDLCVAGNQEDAVSMASAEKPDLILMDLQLPLSATGEEVDNEAGLGATRVIKANDESRDVPIIALTAHNMFHQRERIFDAGCTDLQAKPYDFDALLATIEKHLK